MSTQRVYVGAYRTSSAILAAASLFIAIEGCGAPADPSASPEPEDIAGVESAVTSTDFTDATGTVKVRIKTCDLVGPAGVNEARCTMDAGWVLVGGGAEIDGEGSPGSLLKASFPSTNDLGGGVNKTWVARSAESVQTDSHRLRAYAIGLQLVGMSEATLSGFNNLWRAGENTSTVGTNVTIDTTSVPFGFTLIGGGAEVVFNTNKIYLTQSQPVFDTNNGFGYVWRAAAKNNQTSDTGGIKAYVVAVKTCPDGWNGNCLRVDRPLVTSGSGSGYLTASATIGSPWVTTSIGGLARQGGSARRYLTDLIPLNLAQTSQGFTVRTKSHGGSDTATMDGVGLGLEAAYWKAGTDSPRQAVCNSGDVMIGAAMSGNTPFVKCARPSPAMSGTQTNGSSTIQGMLRVCSSTTLSDAAVGWKESNFQTTTLCRSGGTNLGGAYIDGPGTGTWGQEEFTFNGQVVQLAHYCAKAGYVVRGYDNDHGNLLCAR